MTLDSPAGAIFDADRVYRYRLWRAWGDPSRRCLFIMLNPSTADEFRLDPTIRRCVGFARDWGYGAVDICNLFAMRATSPRILYEAEKRGDDSVGPRNDDAIVDAVSRAERVIVAWGTHGALGGRAADVTRLLARAKIYRLGVNADGSPRHPLYVNARTRPQRWRLR